MEIQWIRALGERIYPVTSQKYPRTRQVEICPMIAVTLNPLYFN